MIRSVLVADDTAFFRSLIKDMLAPYGFEVLEAQDGSDAVGTYQKARPDLVLMDLVMPGMDGIRAAEQILELDPRARIILCSGVETTTLLEKASKVKLSGIQFKPVKAERLLELIEQIDRKSA